MFLSRGGVILATAAAADNSISLTLHFSAGILLF
jgi:hypothetical protein